MNGLRELSNIYDLQLLCSTDAVECHFPSSLVKLVCISTDRRRFHDMQMITSTTRSDTKIHRRLPNYPVQVTTTMANVNIQLECHTANTKLSSCFIKTKHCVYSCIYSKDNKAEMIF